MLNEPDGIITSIPRMRYIYIYLGIYKYVCTYTLRKSNKCGGNSARHLAARPGLFCLHPQKGITICVFFLTYYAFIFREEIASRKNIAEKFKIGNLIGVERKQK